MEAFNYETNILSITDEDELEAYLIDQRHLFATKENVALCRQELYDLTSNQIIDLLQSDTYLDPRLFIRLLEDKFKCNINPIIEANNKGFLYLSNKEFASFIIVPRASSEVL